MNERLKELAEQAGFDKHHAEHDTRIKQLIELVRQDEREACAKLCEKLGDAYVDNYAVRSAYDCAEAIRARSKHD